MKFSNHIIATLAALSMLAFPIFLQAQFIDAPDDMVINCDLDIDYDALYDIDDVTFGRIVSAAGLRQVVTTFDKLTECFCNEYNQDVIYAWPLPAYGNACDYYRSAFDPADPDKMFNLQWGLEGYTLNADSVTVDVQWIDDCFIREIRRTFTAYNNGATATSTQSIYVHTKCSAPFYVNEKNIEDSTDCIDFHLLDTVYFNDCTINLTSIPTKIPVGDPLYDVACSDCFHNEQLNVTFSDSIISPTPNGYLAERIYYVVDWCTGEVHNPRDTFNIECIKSSLEGTVYYDSIENCTFNTTERGLNQWKVNATGASGFFSTFTDNNGDYNFAIPKGDYTVEVVPPSTLWEPCANQSNVQVTIPNDSSTVDWGIGAQADTICSIPIIEIDLARFRRCRLTHIDLIYSNAGTKDITNGEIVIELPDEISFIRSQSPSQDLGNNTYALSVGTIKSGQRRTERIEVRISCHNIQTGESLCVTANLELQDSCKTSNSSSLIETNAICRNDSVILTIENKGADMETEQSYWIVEEDLIMFIKRFKLDSSKKVVEQYLADGSTYFIIAENNASRNFEKSISGIEGCTSIDSLDFTTGLLGQFKFNNLIRATTSDCQIVTGPYDPNDKTSSPLGLGDKKEIFNDQHIDYKIRFQNTGNDTAFTVIIRDTLDSNLDLSSIQYKSSSHDVKFHLDNDILSCHFFNIMLPDSNVNFLASNGYVSFSIKPIAGIRPGTLITNNADIYFDFEDPIKTNESLLRIFDEITKSPGTIKTSTWNISIHPNPVSERMYINNYHKNVTFGIINMHGQIVKSGKLNRGSSEINMKNVRPGVYSILFANGSEVDTRKIVVQ